MKRATSLTLLAVLVFSTRSAAMSSASWSTEPFVNDDGGGSASSAGYSTVLSISKHVAGTSTSASWRNEIGFIVIEEAGGDYDAPGPVTGFTAAADGDTAIDLSWTNPTDGDLEGVVIFRREGAAPTFTPTREATYSVGTDYGDSTCVFCSAGTQTTDIGLTAETQYFYAAYAYDAVPNYSTSPAEADATTAVDLAPTVTLTVPADGAAGVEPDVVISVTFSEAMNQTATEAAISMRDAGAVPVPGTASLVGDTLRFTPAAALEAETTYTVTIAATATDAVGTEMAAPYEFSFTLRPAGTGWFGGGGCTAARGALAGNGWVAAVLLALAALAARPLSCYVASYFAEQHRRLSGAAHGHRDAP